MPCSELVVALLLDTGVVWEEVGPVCWVAVPVSVDLGVEIDWWVIISMIVLCNANTIVIADDKRRSGLPSAPLDMEYDKNSIGQ